MILNSGLDHACTIPEPQQLASTFGYWIDYACFGTGSTTPNAADTTLDAQVGPRTNNDGGFTRTNDAGVDPNTNTIWFEATLTRVFNITGNANATEWGLAPATTGNLSVRELFRSDPLDNQSNPITLTLEDGDQLQLVVTVRIEAEWEYATKSFVIAGAAGNDTNGTHEGQTTVTSGASTTSGNISAALRAAWPGNSQHVHVWTTDQSSRTKSQDATGNSDAVTAGVNDAYTPGNFYRDINGTFSTSAANGNHHAWCVSEYSSTSGSAASGFRGLRFILTDPPYLTKASTHRLTLTLRKSISRL